MMRIPRLLRIPVPVPRLPLPSTLSVLSDHTMRIAESWAPVVGVVTAILLYLAPARAVWRVVQKARKRGNLNCAESNNEEDDDDDDDIFANDPLNGLNPLPIAIMPAVAVSWFFYGLVASDPYLVMGNLPGVLLSVAYLIGILPIMNYNTFYPDSPAAVAAAAADAMENPGNTLVPKSPTKQLFVTHVAVLLSAGATLALWATLGLMTSGVYGMFHIGGLEFGMGYAGILRKGIIAEGLGVYAASLFIVLCLAPLSTIRTVLQTKNSQSILGQLTAAQCVNTGLWTAYGLAANDHFVWGPNIIVSGSSVCVCVCGLLECTAWLTACRMDESIKSINHTIAHVPCVCSSVFDSYPFLFHALVFIEGIRDSLSG